MLDAALVARGYLEPTAVQSAVLQPEADAHAQRAEDQRQLAELEAGGRQRHGCGNYGVRSRGGGGRGRGGGRDPSYTPFSPPSL